MAILYGGVETIMSSLCSLNGSGPFLISVVKILNLFQGDLFTSYIISCFIASSHVLMLEGLICHVLTCTCGEGRVLLTKQHAWKLF